MLVSISNRYEASELLPLNVFFECLVVLNLSEDSITFEIPFNYGFDLLEEILSVTSLFRVLEFLRGQCYSRFSDPSLSSDPGK